TIDCSDDVVVSRAVNEASVEITGRDHAAGDGGVTAAAGDAAFNDVAVGPRGVIPGQLHRRVGGRGDYAHGRERRLIGNVAVKNAASSGGKVTTSVNLRVADDLLDVSVLTLIIVDAGPVRALIFRTIDA